MDMRPLFSEYQWPRVESSIRQSIDAFTLRRLQPPAGSSAQYPDPPGNQTSSFAQTTMAQRSNPPTRMLQDELHDPTRVRGRVLAPSQHLANFSFGNEMLHEQQPNRIQRSGRGNETNDSAYYTTFHPTNMPSQTGTGFAEGGPVVINDCVDPSKVFQLRDDIVLTNPSDAQEQSDLLDIFFLPEEGSSQHRQNRY